MKKIYILGVVIVLGCSMWVSFNHTLALYWSGHFRNKLEWGGTIAAEVSFLMGILMILDSHRKGYKPPWQARMLFIAGLFVVGWSNASAGFGYEKDGKWTGFILGLLVLVFIYGAESVLSHAFIRSRKEKENAQSPRKEKSPNQEWVNAQQNAQTPEPVTQSPKHPNAQSPNHPTDHPNAQKITQTPNHPIAQAEFPKEEPPAQMEEAARTITQPVVTQINKMGRSPKEETARNQSPKNEESSRTEQIAQTDRPTARAERIAQKEIAQKEIAQPVTQTKPPKNEESPNESPKKEESPKTEPTAQTVRPGGKVISLKKKKVEDKLKKYKKPDKIREAIEAIWEYEAEHNDYPTKRKLMELAGCSDHVARTARKIVEELEESQQTG